MTTAAQVRTDPRLAGGVRRYHTWPMLREQSVAEHSWNVARILMAICPNASPAMLREALLHDVGEIATGDPPYPLKKEHPELKAIYNDLEASARRTMYFPWGLPSRPALSEEEERIIKLADMAEMWETGLQELTMGNKLAAPIVKATYEWLSEQIGSMEKDITRSLLLGYMEQRLRVWGADL